MQQIHPDDVLNPFIFPTETDGRFTMLILSVLMVCLYCTVFFLSMAAVVVGPNIMADALWMFGGMHVLYQAIGNRTLLDLTHAEIRELSNVMPWIYGNALILGLPRLGLLTLFF